MKKNIIWFLVSLFIFTNSIIVYAQGNSISEKLESRLESKGLYINNPEHLDFCAICGCCTEDGVIDWSIIQEFAVSPSVRNELIVIPTYEAKEIVELHQERLSGPILNFDALSTSRATRLDVCERCQCCTESSFEFSWDSLEIAQDAELDSIKNEWTVIPQSEFNTVITEILR